MRIRMLKDVATVGQFLEKGEVYEVQDLLAKALIGRGQAEDAFKPRAPRAPKVEGAPVKPEVKPAEPEVVEEKAEEAKPEAPAEETKPEEVKPEKEPEKKPAKMPAKKPASKKVSKK